MDTMQEMLERYERPAPRPEPYVTTYYGPGGREQDYVSNTYPILFDELNRQGYVVEADTAGNFILTEPGADALRYLQDLERVSEAAEHAVRREKAEQAARWSRDEWNPACGGTETPFTYNGESWIYVYNGRTGKHAYLNLNTDMIADDYR